MKTLILDGSQKPDWMANAVQTALTSDLQAQGAAITHIRVADAHIGPCMGDFFCWVRTPGLCIQNDDNRIIGQEMIRSDLLIYLTPITFGGYASELKRAVDHLIPNISPFFTLVNGEVHHKSRYARYPRFLVIGWLPEADPNSEAIFQHLVHRNAINLNAPSALCGILHGRPSPEDVRRTVSGWLDTVMTQDVRAQAALPVESIPILHQVNVRKALLLVGSPHGKKSTSQALGGYLFEQLAARGIETQTIRLYTVQKSEARKADLLKAIAAADLVTLAFPLYVDSLPAPVTRVLEWIAAYRQQNAPNHPQVFSAIVNCGFPEARQNQVALAICQNFARLTGFDWAGGLALGAGGGVVHGAPLVSLGRRAAPFRKSLELAAEALAVGKPVPPEAVRLMGRTIIPGWLYCIFGNIAWVQLARAYHAQKRLKAQPYKAL